MYVVVRVDAEEGGGTGGAMGEAPAVLTVLCLFAIATNWYSFLFSVFHFRFRNSISFPFIVFEIVFGFRFLFFFSHFLFR